MFLIGLETIVVRRAEQSKYSLESIDRMISVLDALETAHDQSLEQIAKGAKLSESTALRYLMSLTKHDFVERNNATGSFRLGLRLFRLGSLAIDRRDISSISQPVMARLLAGFGESVNLATRQQSTIVLIRVLDSPNPLRKGSRVGETDSWHATSLGKALMGAMTDADVLAVLNGTQLTPFTPNTMTTAEQISRDLQSVRSRGYAIDDEESVEGLRCVGAAILDHGGVPSYALSVSGPKSRMSYSKIQEIGAALAESATELSRGLGAR
jgi:IclR family acetate operon transcriptional repressor